MRTRRTTVTGRSGRTVCLMAVVAVMIASSPITSVSSQAEGPASQPVEVGKWKKKIKRLKLADPESTEMMLA